METVSIEEVMAEQASKRASVMNSSSRAQSALALAEMALKHGGDGSHAAAQLLLAMEHGKAFDFRLLLKFDSENRAHADLVLMGYQSHHLWPSKWMDEIGATGEQIMRDISDKWGYSR